MALSICNTPVASDCTLRHPLINILIRTHRPEMMEKCSYSIENNCYHNLNCIFCYDNLDGTISIRYRDKYIKQIKCFFDKSVPYHYNLYLNKMMSIVNGGWILVLDDDDKLIRGSLSLIAPYLTDPDQPVICQMLREGKPKPGDLYMDKRIVSKGRIGMPCMIIHSKHKALHTFEATEDADYQWISHVNEKLKCKFVKIPVVDAGKRSNGK